MSPRKSNCALIAVVAGVAAAVVVGAAPAGAAGRPAVPKGVKVASATTHSFTVTADTDPGATKYVLYASKTKSDVVYSNLTKSRSGRHEVSSRKPSLTISGLSYTISTFYYRLQAKNSYGQAVSTIREAHLAPATPTGVTGVTPANTHGLAIEWDVQPALGFQVEQAQDRLFTQNVKTYTLQGAASEFTAYGLTTGQQYYFRVRALNGSSRSGYSGEVPLAMRGHELPMRVLTYNVLHKQFDGTKESGNTIAPWSERVRGIVKLIKEADPDVASINEASDYVVQDKERSIDDIAGRLPAYTLAKTEPFPNPLNPRTGNYILFKTSEFTPIGAGGYWTISYKNWVAYQILENKATRAQFLMVSVHLSHGSNSVDKKRGQETEKLLGQAEPYAARNGNIPVIYAGDFNSYSGPDPTNLDTPEQELRSAHVGDSLVAAQKRSGTQYGSVNDYTRVPSHSGRVIDHVFGSAGVAFRAWKQLLDLKNGKFVGPIPSDHNPVYADLTVQY